MNRSLVTPRVLSLASGRRLPRGGMTALVLGALLCAFGAAFASGSALAGTQRVAVLAANHSGGEGLELLRYAERDAARLRNVLTELGGVPEKNLFTVIDEDAVAFLNALTKAEMRIHDIQRSGDEAMLLIYYSGHAQNGVLRMGETQLDMMLLKTHLAGSGADIRLALIDSCGAGAITREKGGVDAPPFLIEVENELTAKGQVIIASSSANEASQESDEIQGSFFTHHLTTGLRGDADQNRDGRVTLDEAYTYAYARTVAATAATRGGAQHPTYEYDLRGAGDVVLSRPSVGAVTVTFPEALSGRYFVVDQDRQRFVAEIEKMSGQASRLSLPPGDYVIKKRLDTHLLMQRFEAREKGAVVVDETKMEQVAFEDDYAKGAPLMASPLHPGITTSFTVGVGGQGILFEQNVDELGTLFPGIMLLSLQTKIKNLIAEQWVVGLDLSMGTTNDHKVRVDVGGDVLAFNARYSQAQLGASLEYELEWNNFVAGIGPRLSFFFVHVAYENAPIDQQVLPAFVPGVTAHVGYRLFDIVRLEATTRAGYLLYNVDDIENLAVLEGLISVGIDL